MNDIIPFDFEGAAVRVLDREGFPWFVLADVCRVLEIGNPSEASKRLDADEKMTLSNIEGHSGRRGGPQALTIINESGLYSLVLTSRKAAAKRFKKWVTAEVLPTIRKTGAYSMSAAAEDGVAAAWGQPVASLNAQIRMIAEARAVYGPGAARRLWRASGLPQVEDADEDDERLADPQGCLAHLMRQAVFKHETVGSLIDAALDGATPAILTEMGIRVRPAGYLNRVAVADKSEALSAIFQETAWCDGGWVLGLLGLPGARMAVNMDFNGRKRRAVLVPLAFVNAVSRFEVRAA